MRPGGAQGKQLEQKKANANSAAKDKKKQSEKAQTKVTSPTSERQVEISLNDEEF
jgi:hypothetical protein